MKHVWALALVLVVGASIAVGARAAARPVPATAEPPVARAIETPLARPAEPRAATPAAGIDVRSRLSNWDNEDLAKLEEELEARVREDATFARELFDAFLSELDPMKMSFLQNAIASDPRLRNDPAWQDRFMKVAEADTMPERRKTALLFVQQAEAIATVRDRLYALAETGDARAHALVALKGLPGRRT